MNNYVVNEPKTGTFQLRINPEYKAEVERLFSECGMTLSEAINIFLQMSLKTGGLPFEVNRNPPIVLDNRMFDYLNAEYQKGLASAKEEKDWVPLDEVKKRYGKNR